MMRHIGIIIFCAVCGTSIFAQNGDRNDYINRFKDIAIYEMERTGIPASIKLAQGILESNAGASYLARKANNHFGIKCGKNWKGKKAYRKDDDYDKHGRLQKSCFRAYKSAEESYYAHSDFLRDPKKKNRYSFLFDLDPYDYKAWAKGLKKAGYATSKTYATKLIKVIETYKLDKYDRMSSNDLLAGSKKRKWKKQKLEEVKIAGLDVRENNDSRYVLTTEGLTPREIAEKTEIKLSRIQKYNELLPGPDEQLTTESRVYIEPKRNGFRGTKKWHYIKEGESIYQVSQIYGVKLQCLFKRNRMTAGTEPAIGERLKLRGFKIRKNEQPKARDILEDVDDFDGPVLDTEETTEEDPFMDEEELITPDDPTEKEDEPNKEVEEEAVEELELEQEEEEVEPQDPPIIEEEEEVTELPEEPETPAEVYHTVQSGDTLYAISRKYDTSVDAIKKLNGLTSNIIKRGQKLRVK